MMDSKRSQRGMLTVNLGLAANVLLAGLKTSVGVLGHSRALLADGINSTSDVAYYVVVWVFMRLANKPADDNHPYGHSQMESIGALVVGSFVVTTAVAIFWDSINAVYEFLIGELVLTGASSLALWIGVFTVGLKIVLTYYTMRVGRKTNNAAVMALAYDHRNDIFSALAASVGILLGRLGYFWVDPLAGALVSLVVLQTGIEILRESTSELMDTIPGQTLNQQIIALLRDLPDIKHIYIVINITICVDGSLSVMEGDSIATQVERTLTENIEFVTRVHVHYHPASV
jgi:cation diffusion facilitator family transporter